MLTKRSMRELSVIVVLVVMVVSVARGESSLSWRVFKAGANTWLYAPSGVLLFSSVSQRVRPASIDAARSVDSLIDAVEFDGYLWLSSTAGLYQVDMNSQSSERIAMQQDAVRPGKLALDPDYLWLGSEDTLFQFDRLGREWLTYPLPESAGVLLGCYSNGDDLFCIGTKALYRFTIASEKWQKYFFEIPFTPQAVFYPGLSTFKVVDGAVVAQYTPEAFTWQRSTFTAAPADLFDEDTVVYYAAGSALYRLTSATSTIQKLAIPEMGAIHAVTKYGDTLFMVTDKRVAKYNVSTTAIDFIEYTGGVEGSVIRKVVAQDSTIVTLGPSVVAVFNKQNRSWIAVSRAGLQPTSSRYSWDDQGLMARYGGAVTSRLTGTLQSSTSFKSDGFVHDTTLRSRSIIDTASGRYIRVTDTSVNRDDSTLLMIWNRPGVKANLNLHTTDAHDRFADITFNNSVLGVIPTKKIHYQGNRDDYINSLTVGTTNNGTVQSAVLPGVGLDGGSVVIESKARLDKRDRKVARFAAGSGYIKTKTAWKMLSYNPSGTYYLINSTSGDTSAAADTAGSGFDTTQIVPGSIRVFVDGELLDSSLYAFFNFRGGKLLLDKNAPIDPVSAIAVQYELQTIPDGDVNNVEFIPAHHFGRLHYGAFSLSPQEWLTARVGVTGIDRDTLLPIVSMATPVELRNSDRNFMLKATPDFSYNMKSGARAGSAALQSRLGDRSSVSFNGMFADTNFVATDTLTRGYGALRNEYDLTLVHDIRTEVPVSYYQHRRVADDGTESRYAVNSGVRFKGYPFLKIGLARTVFDKTVDLLVPPTTFDSLFFAKDKVQLQLYETSSKLLEELTHFQKISYDVTHAEYRTEATEGDGWVRGRMTIAEMILSPIQPVTIRGNLIYRGGMEFAGRPSSDVRPTFELQTMDAPRGVDLRGVYQLRYSKFAQGDSSTDSIVRSANVILKPGAWFASLHWFSPRARIAQTAGCVFDRADVRAMDLITGFKGRKSTNLIRGIGAQIYPSEDLVFINDNEWAANDVKSTFRTTNDLQFWLNAANMFQAHWVYITDFSAPQHNATFLYDRIITTWLRLRPMLTGKSITDSTGTDVSGGPKLSVDCNFRDFGIVKGLVSLVEAQVLWNRKNGKTLPNPDYIYTFNLRLDMFPNMQLTNVETLQFGDGAFKSFTSQLNLVVTF